MERRRPTLPTAAGTQHQGYVPHHMSHPNLSTDSTGSADSFATQVPLPFHMLPGQIQNFGYIQQQGGHWGIQHQAQYDQTPGDRYQGPAVPGGHGQYTIQSAQGQKLNPASGTFVPSPTFRSSFDSAATFQTQYNHNSSRPGSFSSSISSYAPQDNQAMVGSGYQNYQAEQGTLTGYFPAGNFQQPLSPQFPVTPQFQAPQAGNFAHMGGALSDFPLLNGAANISTFNTSNPFAQHSPALESIASPTPSHANHVSNAWGTLNQPLSAQPMMPGNAYNHMMAPSGNWMQQPTFLNTGGSVGIGSNSSVGGDQSHDHESKKPSQNQKRSKSRNSGKSQKSWKAKQNQSNLSTAPVLNSNYYGGPINTSNFHAIAQDGPVVASPLKLVSSDGYVKNSGYDVTRTSSRASHQSSMVCKDEGKVFKSGIATPKTKTLNLEFSSERRGGEIPALRSSRGRSISVTAPTTDPGRKHAVTSWLETTPTQRMDNMNLGGDGHRASPPKMASLRPAMGPAVLKSIREGEDPFISKPMSSLTIGGGISSLAGPYRGTLVGQPGMSKELAILTKNGSSKPTVQEALNPQNLPFVEYCRESKHEEWGVIKIKNIPYNVNRPEVLAFLGRNARIIAEHEHEPVHIIMERVTSKTLDCYVEFVNMNEAAAAVNRFETNRTGGRGGRLGQRHVEVELSCQEELMKELFPKAKNVQWVGSKPTILPTNTEDKYNSGFKGFVSSEEMVMLVKHVESPQRSPFSKDCPQRPFECLISTLLKFPWYMVDYITIGERQMLFNTTKELLALLIERMNSIEADLSINAMLFKRVWKAALKCPGFTPTQKDDIVVICGIDEQMARENGVPVFASEWMDLWTIGAKPNSPNDLLLWYIAVIREATERQKQQLSLAELARLGTNANERRLFGDIGKWINHDRQLLPKMTLSQAATAEWGAIESLLRLALGGSS